LKWVAGSSEQGEDVIDDEKVEKDVIGGDKFGSWSVVKRLSVGGSTQQEMDQAGGCLGLSTTEDDVCIYTH
jgi:hypothetical protein